MTIAPRSDIEFQSDGSTVRGWLYRPATASGAVPVVVMAHGLGAVKEMRLDAFAERFAAAGFAVVVFDYRHFGASDGEPRQLLSIRRQLADWSAAIDCAAALDGIDPARIALFGTSFSGGHVLRVAAQDKRVAAVVSQCPFTDGLASAPTVGFRPLLAIAARAGLDLAAAALRRPPVTVPLTGEPGRTAFMNAPDAAPGYTGLVPPNFTHPNAAAARLGLTLPLYRPGRSLRKIEVPVFLGVCLNDTVAPARRTLRYAAAAGPNVEVHEYSAGHFDIYVSPDFDKVVADETTFLVEHLRPS
ncbi:alpha/beta fold hydrolase [Nocardia ninae]|uniref:Alpha/beta hydrolase n=1 Tax=Nocardia ninae NBRC 108245 TaxID=1210091 RepID=A0A511MVZ5_9NOCA|nr:alpha/beta fold hydrolase [Nocardia ninae]GEM44286.1 alpha/beta hydrolase [Nocardia ninae NBRC 108245]